MRRGKRKRAQRLRLIVDTLPYETRLAMLEGLERYEIIAGAYSDRDGGVCPMLAAHRCGGRTDFRSFARAWDRFTGAGRRSRRVSDRELRTLTAQLEISLWNEDQARYGASAIRSPGPSRRRRPRRAAAESGAWLLPARDWDEYRRTVEAALQQTEGEPLDGRQGEIEKVSA